MPDGTFDSHVVERLLELSVSNKIPNLCAAVEAVTELDRFVLPGVFALFLDSLLRLMQPVVVKVYFVDVEALDVMLIHGLCGNGMTLLIRFGTLRVPTLSTPVHETAHLSVPLVGHDVPKQRVDINALGKTGKTVCCEPVMLVPGFEPGSTG